MSLAITVTDQENGGDVVVACTGIPGASTATIYFLPMFPTQNGYTGWTQFGSPITANGNVTGTIPCGFYWWRGELVTGSTTTPSNFVQQVVRSASHAPYHQIVDAVVAKLQDAANAGALPTIPAANIVACYEYNPGAALVNFPGILVMGNDKKVGMGGLDVLDDFAYPVIILACASDAELKPVLSTDYFYRWQQTIEKLFIMNRLPSVTLHGEQVVYRMEFTYPKAVEFYKQSYDHVRVGLQLNVTTREDRSP